jgi:pimeloyl-ACP methyl ester carboxylesterase
VVLVHGLDDPGDLWEDLAPALAAAGRNVCAFTYPNDQAIRESASFFAREFRTLRERGAGEVVLVVHSMGGLVSREMLTSPALGYREQVERGELPQVRHLIMVATPNHGSSLAHCRILAEMREQWTRFVSGRGHLLGMLADGAGEAQADLLPGSPFLKELNARPDPPGVGMTVIAGVVSPLSLAFVEESVSAWKKETPQATHALLDELGDGLKAVVAGVGDGAVALASTRLEGVDDHVTVEADHLSIVHNYLPGMTRTPPAIPLVVQRVARVWP